MGYNASSPETQLFTKGQWWSLVRPNGSLEKHYRSLGFTEKMLPHREYWACIMYVHMQIKS